MLPSTISHFETGRRVPSLATLCRLADALSESSDWLLGRSDKPRAVGPAIERLVKAISKVSDYDIETLTTIAKSLGKRIAK